MLTEKYPSTKFSKISFVKTIDDLLDCFCYIVVVRFKNIESKYENSFISENKCKKIKNACYDNGRIICADEIEIVLTDVDFKFIYDTHNIESYEFLEVYWSKKDYLPKEYIEFILDKYKKKTEYKNVEGKEVLYNLEKQKYNSLYRNDGDE